STRAPISTRTEAGIRSRRPRPSWSVDRRAAPGGQRWAIPRDVAATSHRDPPQVVGSLPAEPGVGCTEVVDEPVLPHPGPPRLSFNPVALLPRSVPPVDEPGASPDDPTPRAIEEEPADLPLGPNPAGIRLANSSGASDSANRPPRPGPTRPGPGRLVS